MNDRHGGQILMEQLKINGVKTVFLVPGESFLPCIDALYDLSTEIIPIVCRQESGATFMAEATGKLIGEPGICFVTRGPGATNASIAVHTAYQDSTPLILFVGQVNRSFLNREAFQEIDYVSMFAGFSKWVAQIESIERIPEYINRAFQVAVSGRPGPVVIALPEDVLWERAIVNNLPSYVKTTISPSTESIEVLQGLLGNAKRPFVILGGSRWSQQAIRDMEYFAMKYSIPVGVTWRRLECFNQNHPSFVGVVGLGIREELRQYIEDADLIVAIGTRLGEAATNGYTIPNPGEVEQKLVHVFPKAEEIGSVYHCDLPIVSDINAFTKLLRGLEPQTPPTWKDYLHELGGAYQRSLHPLGFPGNVNLTTVMKTLDAKLPKDAYITVGAGNYTAFVHRYCQFDGTRISLSPTSGAMGYGLPAAIAAKLESPAKTVVCFAGDGCFQMTMQELGVAAQYKLGIIIIVFNNGTWGTIRMHQEREFPGRTIALEFTNPDFAQMIECYKGHGEVVEDGADFEEALERCQVFTQRYNLPALIEICYEMEGILPGLTLTEIREKGLQKSTNE